MLDLIKNNDGKPGSEVYTPPTPPSSTPLVQVTEEEVESIIDEETEKEEADIDLPEPLQDNDTPPLQEKKDDEVKEVGVVKPVRVPLSRPTSGVEVFNNLKDTARIPPQAPRRTSSVLSFALNFLKPKGPPPDSIRSSTLGLYAAQATMMAGAILGELQEEEYDILVNAYILSQVHL